MPWFSSGWLSADQRAVGPTAVAGRDVAIVACTQEPAGDEAGKVVIVGADDDRMHTVEQRHQLRSGQHERANLAPRHVNADRDGAVRQVEVVHRTRVVMAAPQVAELGDKAILFGHDVTIHYARDRSSSVFHNFIA